MRRQGLLLLALTALLSVPALLARMPEGPSDRQPRPSVVPLDTVETQAVRSIRRGRDSFRYETFGDSLFFSDALRLNEVLAQVTPRQALELGVKVDSGNLPGHVLKALIRGEVDLDDPAVTRFLFSRSAVVGVVADVTPKGGLENLGVTCALCHSTVDDSIVPGVGRRLDGWANRDLDVGAILALAPNLQPVADLLGVDEATVRLVMNSWGPGRFDAHLNLDGVAFRPDGASASVLIPPAFGLAGVNLHTYEGWGSVPYWNAFVAGHEMNGLGRFFDPRLADADKYPIAAAAGFDDVHEEPDLISNQMADLQLYQLALPAPPAPKGSFDREAAARGENLFANKAACAACHVPPLFTEPGYNMHDPEDIGIDAFQADRGPEGRYRTTPLRGLWSHTKGGFYHDGRFATLLEVIHHYDAHFALGLTGSEKQDLVEYLKSL